MKTPPLRRAFFQRGACAIAAPVAAAALGPGAFAQTRTREVPGYSERSFSAQGMTHRLFERGDKGSGVIVLHEIGGLTPEVVAFADALQEHFRITLPLLFGEPLQSLRTGLLRSPINCIRREIHCLRSGRASPVTTWVRALCADVHERCGGSGVGVIGMCMTGGFVLPLIIDPSVRAAVTAQPALPLLRTSLLDVEADVLEQARQGDSTAPLLGLRFERDPISPPARFEAINHGLCGDRRRNCARFEQVIVPGEGHATLTVDYDAAKQRGVDTRARVLAFLRQHLAN